MTIWDHMLAHPITCVSIGLNIGNVFWQFAHGRYGLCVYWTSAAMITFSATWLRNWGE